MSVKVLDIFSQKQNYKRKMESEPEDEILNNQPRVSGITWNLSITCALNIWKVNKGLSYQILQSSFRTFTYIKLQLCEKVLLKEIYFYWIFMLFRKIKRNVFYVICGTDCYLYTNCLISSNFLLILLNIFLSGTEIYFNQSEVSSQVIPNLSALTDRDDQKGK